MEKNICIYKKMGGGLMQLVAYGAQDVYLTGNPLITFFKVIYRRHTNFAMESIEQVFNGNTSFETAERRITTTISRNGDLITKAYLEVELPEADGVNDLKYIENVGHGLIKSVELEIGGQKIDKWESEMFDLWQEVTQKETQSAGYNLMTAPPKSKANRTISWSNSDYKFATEPTSTAALNWMTQGSASSNGYTTASFSNEVGSTGLTLASSAFAPNQYMALSAASNETNGVVANLNKGTGEQMKIFDITNNLTNSVFKIESSNASGVKLEGGITYSGTDSNSLAFMPLIANASNGIDLTNTSGFISPNHNLSTGDYIRYNHYSYSNEVPSTSLSNLEQGCIYKAMSNTPDEFGVSRYYDNKNIIVPGGVNELGNEAIGLHTFSPIQDASPQVSKDKKKLYIPLQFFFNRNEGLALPLIALQYHEVKLHFVLRSYNELMSLSKDTKLPTTPNSVKLFVDYVYLDTDERRRFAQVSHEMLIEQVQFTGDEVLNSTNGEGSKNISLNFNHPVKELIFAAVKSSLGESKNLFDYQTLKSCTLMLNGHERFSKRSADYFKLVQPYQHHTRVPTKDIYVYSFALKPEEHQPSGTCNFSRIDNAQLKIDYESSDTLNLKVFAVSYNVLRIMSGMGGLAFSN
jgi:hypothetical protein